MLPALILALGWECAGAQESAAIMDDITVTATRTELLADEVPAAVTVLTRDDIQRGRVLLGLDEVLNIIPGVFIQNRHNFAQDERVSIRGFGARASFGIRGVAVILDGIPHTLPDGQSQIDGIDLGTVERIEVLRGPASSLYGNAAGGVIHITTQAGPDKDQASIHQLAGAHGLVQTRFQGGASLDKADFRLSASRLELDGFREQSRAEEYRLTGKWRWFPAAATRVVLITELFDSPTAEDPGGVSAEQAREEPKAANPANAAFDAGEEIDQQKLGLSVEHRFGDNDLNRVRFGGFYLARDFANRLPFSDGGQVEFDRGFTGLDFKFETGGSIGGVRHRLTAGIDYRSQDDDRRRFDNLSGCRGDLVFAQQEQITATGVFLQERVELNEHWALTAGLRWDRIELDVLDRFLDNGDDSGERDWRDVNQQGGILWRPADTLTLYANAGTSFQTPTSTELANPADPGSGGGFNRDLEPETARNYELGVRGRVAGRFRYEASIFRTRIKQSITSFEVPEFSGSGREFFDNAGRSTRNGLELMLLGEPVPNLTARLSYTFSDFEFDRFETADGDFSGNRMPGVPRHQFSLRLGYQTDSRLFAEAELNAVGDFYADNANTTENGAYAVVDLRAGGLWERADWRIRGFLGLNNALDERYNENVRVNAFGGRFFEPAPDRHVFVGVEISRLL